MKGGLRFFSKWGSFDPLNESLESLSDVLFMGDMGQIGILKDESAIIFAKDPAGVGSPRMYGTEAHARFSVLPQKGAEAVPLSQT